MKKPAKPILVGVSLLAAFGLTSCSPFGPSAVYGAPAVTDTVAPTPTEGGSDTVPEDNDDFTPTPYFEDDSSTEYSTVYGPPPTEYEEEPQDVYGPPPTEYQEEPQDVYGPPPEEDPIETENADD